MAQQTSNNSLPGQRYLWDPLADAARTQQDNLFREPQNRALQEEWRQFSWELRRQSAQIPTCRGKTFQRLGNDNSEPPAVRELLQLIAKQRAITEDYLNHVTEHVSNRSCPLEQVHRELERVESRNASLRVRLKRAEERKRRLDKTTEVLIDKRDMVLREGPKHLSGDARHAHFQKSISVLEGLKRCKEDNIGVCTGEELQQKMEMEAEEEYPQFFSEEQRGLAYTSVNVDHACDSGPDLCKRSVQLYF